MFKSKLTAIITAIAMTAAMSLQTASAASIHVDSSAAFCFSSNDFSVSDTDEGIFITAVPSANIATICYGDRVLKAGDALPASSLGELTLNTGCVTKQDVSVEYCTVSDGKVTGIKSLKMSIFPKKNESPTADNSSFETYKNIANSGELKANDPEGSALRYQIVDMPKRGNVELYDDGSFTYTPKKNKVGNDSFTFTVTDDAGNVSDPAKVSIKIKKPSDKTTYEDMVNDADQFVALWMKENDIFSGSEIGGHLCFSPDKEVTRGEFLVMVMKLVDANKSTTAVSSGFADEGSTPSWMQPYITAALGNGMIAGTNSEEGLVFRPDEVIEKAEAAILVQNTLSLPAAVSSSYQSEIIPAWALSAVDALSQAGIDLDLTSADDLLTRRDAARLLYSMSKLIEDEAAPTFYRQ